MRTTPLGIAALGAVALLAASPAAAPASVITYFLTNSGADTDAGATARLIDRRGKQSFQVKVDLLAPGDYGLLVGGVRVGTLASDGSGKGKLRFESAPLPFDPRGKVIKLRARAGGALLFHGRFPASRDELRRKIRVNERFSSTGADADARGRVDYRVNAGKTRMHVEMSRLPEGTYDLFVDGSMVASLAVQLDENNMTTGEAYFDSRFGRGSTRLLSFAPLCKRLEVRQTLAGVTTTYLTIDALGSGEGLCTP